MKCFWKGCPSAQTFQEDKHLFDHLISTHILPGKQVCQWQPMAHKPICNVSLRHRGHFAEHILTHLSPQFKPFGCPELCSGYFRSKNQLKVHFKSKHPHQDETLLMKPRRPDVWLSKQQSSSHSSQQDPQDQQRVKTSQADVFQVNLSREYSPIKLPHVDPESMPFLRLQPKTINPIGATTLYASSILQVFSSKCSLAIPAEFLANIQMTKKQGGRIHPAVMSTMVDWLHKANQQALIQGTCRQGVDEIHDIFAAFCAMFDFKSIFKRLEQLKLDLLTEVQRQQHDDASSSWPSNFPSYRNPFREILLTIFKCYWLIYTQCATNEDSLLFLETRPENSAHVPSHDCRGAMLGVKLSIRCRQSSNSIQFAKKGCQFYMNRLCHWLNQGALESLVWGQDWPLVSQLCCQGEKCHALHLFFLNQSKPSLKCGYSIENVDERTMIVWLWVGLKSAFSWSLPSRPDPQSYKTIYVPLL